MIICYSPDFKTIRRSENPSDVSQQATSISCVLLLYTEQLLICRLDPTDRGVGPNVGYQSKVRVIDRYKVIGFISSGTYGRVYKAVGRHGQTGEFAIKKFKPGM